VSVVAEVAAPRARTTPRRGVVPSLARVEARRLLLHPLVLLGLAMSALLTWQVTDEDSLAYLVLMGAGVLPLAIGVMLAANAAALRARRDDADELYTTLPAPASARTAAVLAAVGVAALATVAVVVVQATVLGAWSGLEVTYWGQVETPAVLHLVQGPLLVGLFGALGVALARLLPTLAAGPLVAVLVLLASIPLVAWGPDASWRWLFPPVNAADVPGGDVGWPCDRGDRSWCPSTVAFDDGTLAVHAGYLIALTALAAAVALLRDGRTRRRLAAAVAAAAVVAVLAVVQVA
jgi:hypothetical protein